MGKISSYASATTPLNGTDFTILVQNGTTKKTTVGDIIGNTTSIDPGHKHSKLWASDGSPEAVTINAAGNVGIGTTNPGARLDVKGSVSANNTIYLTNGSTGNYANIIQGRDASGTLNGSLGFSSYDNSIFFTQPSGAKMVIDTNGNVGIGTTSPQRKLTVGSGTASDGIIQIFNGASGAGELAFGIPGGTTNDYKGYIDYFHNTNKMVFGTNSGDKVTIQSDGNVGIGTTSPGSSLQVNGNAVIGYAAGTATGANGLAISGNVGIGTTAPANALAVVGSISIGSAGVARGTTAGTNRLDIFDGTAPAGTLTNGCSVYSTSGELYTMDAAGNATLQTPHDEHNLWVFDSVDTVTGKRLKIDMEKMMRFLNDQFGTDFVHDSFMVN